MKLFNKSKTTKSPDRFVTENTEQLTASELLTKLNKQREVTPSSSRVVSQIDLFGKDTANYSPKAHTVAHVTVDGRTFSFKDVTRGITNLVTNKTSEEALIVAEWFALMAKALKKNAPMIDKVRQLNQDININKVKVAELAELYEAQRRYESGLTLRDLESIESNESSERRIADLEATVAQLTATLADTKTEDEVEPEVETKTETNEGVK